MPGGHKRRRDPMVYPNPFHAGSHVKGNGTYRSSSGLRWNYRCTPNGDRPYDFAVVIAVEDKPVPVYLPPPPCPLHGRDGRRARNGTYGKPGETVRRQRYRCWPMTPDPNFPRGFHNYTPAQAREHVHSGENHCHECEERRNVHRGDQVVARTQSWNLRAVAEGLEQLTSGAETYSSVDRWAWQATGRVRSRPAKLSDAERERRAKQAAWRQGGPRSRSSRPAADGRELPALAARNGSSDRPWADLAAYRDALAARHAAAQRERPTRPHRRGHSAPATRPIRRRFTAPRGWSRGHPLTGAAEGEGQPGKSRRPPARPRTSRL